MKWILPSRPKKCQAAQPQNVCYMMNTWKALFRNKTIAVNDHFLYFKIKIKRCEWNVKEKKSSFKNVYQTQRNSASSWRGYKFLVFRYGSLFFKMKSWKSNKTLAWNRAEKHFWFNMARQVCGSSTILIEQLQTHSRGENIRKDNQTRLQKQIKELNEC